jgi:leucyl-tRNA synthetase
MSETTQAKAAQKSTKKEKKVETAKLPDKPEVKSHARRDFLNDIEVKVQKKWADAKIYEVDANEKQEKYFVTFPYPYMNGKLHLGHAFSVTKAEFMARYQRMLGKNVLFPFGFHCTGMPIKACADRIQREMEEFGTPPHFPPKKPKTSDEEEEQKRQWEIMQQMGIGEDQIPKFADAYYWLKYFPPIAEKDLQRFGLAVDFRRSFITTDMNPYYDSFIRWQFTHLKEKKKVVFGTRPSIYSPLDDQICADHDRAKGEGVKPKEYTIIKLKLVEPFPEPLKSCAGKNVYLAAATLRPETMYGQTNCWLKPDGEYGAFEVNDTDIFVCTERAALNMAYQNLSKVRGKVSCVAKFTGQDLMGCAVEAPNAPYAKVHVLPMLTIDMKKTTGVVTSVPSDSPDDYAALTDLKAKPKLREKFNIKDEHVLPFEVVPIIKIPNRSDAIAPELYQSLKIQSQNDTAKLTEAKDIAYLEGFTHGVMNERCGAFSGMPVKDAKEKIKQDLIDRGLATKYSEPESLVVSRSGDVCVVALTDQWFLAYGEDEWKQQVENWINDNNPLFKTYHPAVRKELKETVDWLREWGCSRSYGLGTKMPWDERYLIESLSDSTIYMAYYTIAHMLHLDLEGSKVNPEYNIKPEQLTQKVWDYILMGTPYPADAPNVPSEATLAKLRKEFEYWYPVNLRVSGKDLIKNHLTMFLYNHCAMWPDQPAKRWPGAIFANGYIMVDSEKMSKSKGNFLTVEQVCNEYSADATRIALADAGDSTDDANFSIFTANSSILRLYVHIEFIKEVVAMRDSGKLRKGDKSSFQDRVFENKINKALIECKEFYDKMLYREVLKTAWFDFESARDTYRTEVEGGMHEELIFKWIEAMTLMLAPITPHISEYIWTELLQKSGSVVTAKYPDVSTLTVDKLLLQSDEYLHNTLHMIRTRIAKEKQKPTFAYIYVADKFLPWQITALNVLKSVLQEKGTADDSKYIASKLKEQKLDGKLMSTAMGFIAIKLEAYAKEGPSVLEPVMPFDEYELLTQQMNIVKLALGGLEAKIFKLSEPDIPDPQKRLQQTQPGHPTIAFLVEKKK